MRPEITDKLETLLGDKTVCYVLITCQKPDDAGKMDVEFAYSGDPMLASYLLGDAQARIDCDVS